jgi:hypothetical protein
MEREIMNSSAHLGTPSQPLGAAWQRTARRGSWLLLPLAIVLLVPWLIPGYFAVPVVFDHCSVRQALQAESETSLRLDSFQTQQGTEVVPGGRFCDGAALPLRLRGTTALDPQTHLWVVLTGDKGQFYLQYPPVKIQQGQWTAQNLRPWGIIRAIHFLRVGEFGHQQFSERAARNDWDQFASLPADADEVAVMGLEPEPPCIQFDARNCAR